ncbi:MAG: hypothetical protein E7491_02720 [Ruminococcaceae bacterium]|nr:hypothetical protein [Oscillospiraceae bacterium]
MKWLILGIGIVCAAASAVALAVKKRRKGAETDDVDGGVRHYNSGDDAPKEIKSTEITEFNCTFSLFADAEEGELECGLYKCKAVLNGGAVDCNIRWRDRTGKGDDLSFEADAAFMENLQQIACEYNLAKHNGYSYSVSGLPDMYGALLDIRYASGESIYAYNNQSNFLPRAMLKKLFDLFTSLNK